MTRPDLPKDLVEEILSFIPATKLRRLRATCKRWNRLIKEDGRFVRKNYDKAEKQFVTLMLRDDYRICPLRVNLNGVNPSVEVKSELSLVDPQSKNNSGQFEMSDVSHCEGLLLCIHRDESRMVIWNPLTGETSRRINILKKEARSFCLGYSNKSSSYKILSCASCSNDFEIYEFETDSWRRVVVNDDDDDINAPGGWNLGGEVSVSLKGNVYMFAFENTETTTPRSRSISLLKFDFSTEKSQLVPFPYKCRRFVTKILCVVREEKLSVLLQREINGKAEIWVTNKIDDEKAVSVSWSKVLTLDLIPLFHLSDYLSFILDEEKKVVIFIDKLIDGQTDESKDVLYIVGEDNKPTIVYSRLDTYDRCWPVILDYVPSLVHIDPAGRKRKRDSIIHVTKKLLAMEAPVMMEVSEPQKAEISLLTLIYETLSGRPFTRELASFDED